MKDSTIIPMTREIPRSKTPDEIYTEVESRWAMARAQRRSKLRQRFSEAFSLAAPLGAFLFWAFRNKVDPVGIGVGLTCLAFAWSELRKRWALEDRVEELEKTK